MGFKTIISKATTTGESLRTTIPMSIVKQFGLKEGDEINWDLKVENNKLVIEVEPQKRDNEGGHNE